MPRKLVLTAASLATSACALAQQAPAPAATTATATVEVKASADTQRRNDTASRVIVHHDELVQYGDRSALDALKRLPGVTVSDGGVRMRGLGSGYTQVLVDGQRMPPGFSLEALAPDAIERIEVIRAATAEYSTASIAGTINIVLRKSVGKRGAEVKLGTGGGHGYRAPGLTLAMSGKDGALSYLFDTSLSHWTRDYWSDELFTARDAGGELTAQRNQHSGYAQRFLVGNTQLRLNRALGGGDTLSWQTFFNSGHAEGTEDNRTATLAGPDYPYPLLPAAWRMDSRSLRSKLALGKRIGADGKLDATVGLDLGRQDRDLARQGLRGNALLLDSRDTSRIRNKGLTSTGKYVVPLLEGHAFAVGWDASDERDRQRDLRTDRALPGTLGLDVDTRLRATIDRLAVYGQDEWDVRAGWSVYLGARWEGVRTRTSGNSFAPVSTRYSVFSPLAQTMWKIPGSNKDQVRLGLSRTYRAPTLQDLAPSRFYTSVNNEVSGDTTGNPALRPELATGVDLAYEHYVETGGLVSVSATTRSIRDFIRRTTTFDGARWVTAPLNQGDAEVRSLALEAKLPFKTLGIAWPVEARGNLSRNWSQVDAVPGPTNRLDRQPRWSANLGADYGGKRFSTGASFNFVSGGWTRASSFESSYGGVTRDLEAYALYKFDPLRQLRVTARNLLAQERIGGSSYADADGVTGRTTTGPTWRSWRLQYEQTFQ